mmetsp:Transcript_26808/g.47331  ORF Transcript_26808/g.47331 Transcript_26808/m.47331 type:complete len:103 (-) Transcript_26808:28-336(-)
MRTLTVSLPRTTLADAIAQLKAARARRFQPVAPAVDESPAEEPASKRQKTEEAAAEVTAEVQESRPGDPKEPAAAEPAGSEAGETPPADAESSEQVGAGEKA